MSTQRKTNASIFKSASKVRCLYKRSAIPIEENILIISKNFNKSLNKNVFVKHIFQTM